MQTRFMCTTIAATAFCTLWAGFAAAQTQADQMKVAYQAARNQLGVLQFCQDKGYADTETVGIQQKLVALIPPPADASGGDEAEAIGRKGTVSAMGVNQDLEAAAKAQNSTVETMCKAMADAIKQAGASLPK